MFQMGTVGRVCPPLKMGHQVPKWDCGCHQSSARIGNREGTLSTRTTAVFSAALAWRRRRIRGEVADRTARGVLVGWHRGLGGSEGASRPLL